ncbi:interferon a3-like [Oncorhynchus clarkii lewisi]|uniref:interferon a3-like n=1 Tax=Oncorhynchus clarkii lewisi TaxID=490388 RepID=UPI0039B88A22
MYTMQSWTCIVLIICSMQSVCHCCDWIRHHYGHLSAEYLSLLDQMRYQETLSTLGLLYCKVRFRNEAIYKITKLFDGNMKSVTWNKKNLDDFLKILENQFENLNSCKNSQKKRDQMKILHLHDAKVLFHFVRHVSPAMKPERRLKRYFKKLNRKVLRKMVSLISTTVLIRKEMKRHLQILDILVAQLY